MLKRISLLALQILACGIVSPSFAQEARSPDAVVDALERFARCDASFFNTLKTSPAILGPSVKVENRGAAATPVVADPLDEKGRDQIFTAPLIVGDLRLVSWHNEVWYDAELGGFVFWGFKAEGEPTDVAKKLNGLISASLKVARSGDVWVRSEIRLIGDPIGSWRTGGKIGVVTPRGAVERVLMLESESPGQTSIWCSVQGAITVPLVQALRPDLLPSEYPQ